MGTCCRIKDGRQGCKFAHSGCPVVGATVRVNTSGAPVLVAKMWPIVIEALHVPDVSRTVRLAGQQVVEKVVGTKLGSQKSPDASVETLASKRVHVPKSVSRSKAWGPRVCMLKRSWFGCESVSAAMAAWWRWCWC